MERAWTVRPFKVDKSVGLPMPEEIGVAAGESWRLIEDGEGFRLERIGKRARGLRSPSP
jgi:hypothetical protein